MSADDPLSATLTFQRGGAGRVALERAALLEAVEDLGSISAAAKRLGLSYRGAWDAVQAMNNLFDAPLVAAAPGGKAGGEASVTPRGRAVIAAFRQVEREIAQTLARLEGGFGEVFWSLGMRTSARNALRGVVASIDHGGVKGKVAVDIGGEVPLVAVITRQSIEDLALAPGKPVIALIKSSFVTLSREGVASDAINQLCGEIVMREDDESGGEIMLDVGGGKMLTASLAVEAASALGLGPGDRARAAVEPSHVILAVE